MREIKFRGKRIDNGEWVYGGVTSRLHSPEEKTQIVSCQFYEGHEDDEHYIFIDVYPETVGQFTGLRDVNGVEIYEGDACTRMAHSSLQNADNRKHLGEIRYNRNRACFYFSFDNGRRHAELDATRGFDTTCCDERIEIIGNIHENQ